MESVSSAQIDDNAIKNAKLMKSIKTHRSFAKRTPKFAHGHESRTFIPK